MDESSQHETKSAETHPTHQQCSVNHFVISAAVILFWRGLWNLQELLILPDHPDYSSMISLVFGFGLYILTYSVIHTMKQYSLMLNQKCFSVYFKRETLLTVYSVACISFWRGLWALFDAVFLPDLPVMSNLIPMIAALMILIYQQKLNSVLSDPVFPHLPDYDPEIDQLLMLVSFNSSKPNCKSMTGISNHNNINNNNNQHHNGEVCTMKTPRMLAQNKSSVTNLRKKNTHHIQNAIKKEDISPSVCISVEP